MVPIGGKHLQERLAYLAALDPVNADAFLKALAVFKNGGVDFMLLFGNGAALSLLSGITGRGPFDRCDWALAWLLRNIGVSGSVTPCFTVAIRSNPDNIARFKTAWATLAFEGDLHSSPATLTWNFILDPSYKGVVLETLWNKRRFVAEIEGCVLYQTPDMMGFSPS